MTASFRLLSFALILSLAATSLAADRVTGWRGDGDGVFANANPPTEWSADQNVVWKTKMPDWSNAHPVIVGDRLFVNAEPNTLICVDRKSGKILWQRTNRYEDALSAEEIAKIRAGAEGKVEPLIAEKEKLEEEMSGLFRQMRENRDDKLRGKIRGMRLKVNQLRKQINEIDPLHMPDRHADNGYTSAVPVSDGEYIYTVYGNGVASCFDLNGKRQWSKFIEKPNHPWGHSASPALAGDIVAIHILDVVGLDRKTGETHWRTPAKESWGSPIVAKIGGVDAFITAGEADVIRAADGKKMVEKVGGLQFSTPFVQDGTIYFIERKASAYKLPEKLEQGVAFEKLWESRIKGSRHYASSVIHDGLIYATSREGWLSVLDQKTGELIYERELGVNGDNVNSVYPSLSVAGNHVFIGFEEGVTLALQPGREYKEIARNELEKFRGSPIFMADKVYLRGLEHLYCLGK